MSNDDMLAVIEELVDAGSPESRAHLNYSQGDNFGTGLPGLRVPAPKTFVPNVGQLPPDTAEGFSGFQKWHNAFGDSINSAIGPAAMAAVGMPAAGLLGTGARAERPPFHSAIFRQEDDDEPLANPQDTFGLTSNVGRHLKMNFDADMHGSLGWQKLADNYGGDSMSAGFLAAFGEHITQALPSYRQYASNSGDPNAQLKATAFIVSQIEFADEWPDFDFEGETGPLVMKEWHSLLTTGRGNADVAVDGVTKFLRAVEWVQHPELLISPVVALSYANLDDDQAAVGVKVAQWQKRDIAELSDGQITARMKAIQTMHPSGLMEPLVDNVRTLMTAATGGREADLEFAIEKWRDEKGTPKELDEVSHVAGLKGRILPSTSQMRLALQTVAREVGRVNNTPVTPEEINALTADSFAQMNHDLEGSFEQAISGESVPNLSTLIGVDTGTDFRRYKDRLRNIRMEVNAKPPKEALAVTVEAAADGTFKVMSEDGSSAFRNRAVGSIRHNGRLATVPVRPRMSSNVQQEFDSHDLTGSFFSKDVMQDHPAFGEGAQMMVTLKTERDPESDLFETVVSGLGRAGITATPRTLPAHQGVVRNGDQLDRRSQQGRVFDFAVVADMHRAAEALLASDTLSPMVDGGELQVRFYTNTEMDRPPGTVKQWETFSRDDQGNMAVIDTEDGFASRTDQVPHYRFPTQQSKQEPEASTQALRLMDGEQPWGAGETLFIHVPELDSGEVPTASHAEEDIAHLDQSLIVAATRKSNGNVVVSLPAEDGKVETMLAKLSHELMRNLGRKQVSMGVRDE